MRQPSKARTLLRQTTEKIKADTDKMREKIKSINAQIDKIVCQDDAAKSC